MGERVHLRVDGQTVPAKPGESVALALVRSGRWVFGRSVKYHRPRGPTCFRARCEGCLMRVDGIANEMTCQVPAKDGMRVETQNVLGSASVDLLSLTDWVFPKGMDHHHMFTRFKPTNAIMQKIARRVAGVGTLPDRIVPVRPVETREVDVLVIGAGPCGIAAANAAARTGARVCVLEESVRLADGVRPGPPVEVLRRAVGVAVHQETDAPTREVLAQVRGTLVRFVPRALIVATGVSRGTLVFAGNDLPGIIGPHAARMLSREGIDLGRVVVIGDAEMRASLQDAGLNVVRAIDAADVAEVVAAGSSAVSRVHVGREKIACDTLVAGGPPSGRYELAGQAGAQVAWVRDGFRVVVDDDGRAAHALFAVGACADHDHDLELAARAGAEAGALRGRR